LVENEIMNIIRTVILLIILNFILFYGGDKIKIFFPNEFLMYFLFNFTIIVLLNFDDLKSLKNKINF
jgi:hypothetical protein